MTAGSDESAPMRLLVASLERLDGHLTRNWRWYLALGFALFISAAAIRATFRALWYDELFTYYVARLSGYREIWDALARGADNHPPLDYWMRHFAISAFGESHLAIRLPSLIGFAIALGCVFRIVSVHAGPVSGLLAFVLPFSSVAAAYSYEGRAYAWVLACGGLSLVFWQAAVRADRRAAYLIGLGLTLATGVMLHYYAVLLAFPVAVAELVRTMQGRRVDVPVWLAIAGGTGLALAILTPFIQGARQYADNFWTPVTVTAMLDIYPQLFDRLLIPLTVFLALFALLAAVATHRAYAPAVSPALPEIGAGITLLLFPAIIAVMAKTATGALHFRYALCTVLGVSILAGLVTSRWPLARMALFLPALVIFGQFVLGSWSASAPDFRLDSKVERLRQERGIPVVFSDAIVFLPVAHYASESERPHLFYVVDAKESALLIGNNQREKAFSGLRRLISLNAVEYGKFTADHREFLLVAGTGWILPKLLEEQAAITLILRSAQGAVYDVRLRSAVSNAER